MNVVQVSFDQYLGDTPRVLNALFQEEQSQQLDQVFPTLVNPIALYLPEHLI